MTQSTSGRDIFKMGDALAQRPRGDTVTDFDMLAATLLQIRCRSCAKSTVLLAEIREFNKQLHRQSRKQYLR